MYGSKRMAYILPKLHRIQASTSTWFSASPFFQNVEVDSASLFLAGFIILMDLFGLLVAAFYLRLWGNTRAKMGQQVEVQSWWCLMRGMGQGPLLGRQYTVGIVGRVLLVYVDLATWSNFRSQNMSSVMDFKDEFLFFNINEGVGRLILLFGYKISQDAKKIHMNLFNKTTDIPRWFDMGKTGLVIETLKSTGGETGGEFGAGQPFRKGSIADMYPGQGYT